MTTVINEATEAAPQEFTTDASVSVWNVATIAAMTRDVAKLEVKLADVDPAGHTCAKQLEEDIDAMILSAAESFSFDTTQIFKLGAQVSALKRYSVTHGTPDLREAFGPSRVVYIHDGIEEESVELAAA
jgi:hypothetical protein